MEHHLFTPEIDDGAKADVYLASAGEVPWDVVAVLDAAGVRVVGDVPGLPRDEARIRRIVSGCDALITTGNGQSTDVDTASRISAELGLPHLVLERGAPLPEIMRRGARARPYAFFVGRLERDFTLAREAIRAAIEREAGIACLWADDGRHRTSVTSVRESTRMLIEHASFVIADLTLGIENPRQENPSRAHEIGMAMAYQRPLMLSSQEPRRYPYFSIGDLQMTFWETEDELERRTRSWVRAHAGSVARRVFNHELPSPVLAPTAFVYDRARRYIGPNTPMPHADAWANRAMRTGAVAVSAAIVSVLAWLRR